ncbi:sugar phosphate isomerase/epimerase [Alteromonas aestuariivivens]|uniref:Sugar phosphate isomerase/epimerase n=1 Tax=Alteromonas aestuariivivens TaxID=1938339 RepID=A0A3D8M700_9ALTE|nr:sugar phosphate isomerase/epimerase [Alteromonas aestuariivivens]RDV25430.1 sugar phosphate isomerase/epimerase [Alteromonas aestuariivivens]
MRGFFIALICTLSLPTAVHAVESCSKALPGVSVQLHSVRETLSENFKDTLTALAEMGFEAVEFAGRYGPYADDPQGLKAFLDSLGLKVSGAHVPIKLLRSEQADKSLDFLKAIGAELLIIPHDARVDNPDEIDALITELRVLSARVNAKGMLLGYHNHSKEFKPFNGTTFWDHLAQNTPPEFVLQLDVGWANYAGADPIDYVKRYPHRTLTTHYKIRTREEDKDKGLPVIMGEDNFDWQTLIKTNMSVGDTSWLVVEQEEYPQGFTPLQAVKASKQGLDNILRDLRSECE